MIEFVLWIFRIFFGAAALAGFSLIVYWLVEGFVSLFTSRIIDIVDHNYDDEDNE
jgi:hypothetical protein